eukprot:807501-Rhodomonas_salina.2
MPGLTTGSMLTGTSEGESSLAQLHARIVEHYAGELQHCMAGNQPGGICNAIEKLSLLLSPEQIAAAHAKALNLILGRSKSLKLLCVLALTSVGMSQQALSIGDVGARRAAQDMERGRVHVQRRRGINSIGPQRVRRSCRGGGPRVQPVRFSGGMGNCNQREFRCAGAALHRSCDLEDGRRRSRTDARAVPSSSDGGAGGVPACLLHPRNRIQETAFLVHIVPKLRFLELDCGVYVFAMPCPILTYAIPLCQMVASQTEHRELTSATVTKYNPAISLRRSYDMP